MGVLTKQIVIQSEAKDLGGIHLLLRYVTEILPPFGRLDDKYLDYYGNRLQQTEKNRHYQRRNEETVLPEMPQRPEA